jgi:hypothetical protein
MKRCLTSLVVIGTLVAWQPISESAPEPLQLIDLTDDFAVFHDSTSHLTPEARLVAFHEQFDELFPGFYDAARIPYFTDAEYEAAIRSFIDRYPDHRIAYQSRARRFSRDINDAYADFVERFPDLKLRRPVYLLYSMGEFDGAVREIRGKRYLAFGIDVMEAVHSFENERPFFQHELFHVYHDQFFSGCDAIWCSLWAEGLAVGVAAALNPDANDAELLLTEPEPLRATIDANLKEAVATAKARYDSESEDDYGAFFGSGRLSQRLPPRFGYYLGYLAARRALASGQTINTLAHMSAEQARSVLAQNLEALVR